MGLRLITAVLMFFGVFATDALACSCMPFDYQQAFDEGTGVMVAIAKSREPVSSGSFPQVKYTMEVGKVFQGNATVTTTEIFTASDGAACGAYFELGQAALVWFYVDEEGRLGSHSCFGNGTLESQWEAYKWLEAQGS